MIKFITLIFCVTFAWASLSRKIGGRIIGGNVAADGQFPFIASIYTEAVLGTFFCGGTLITDQYILTAAQCVDGVFTFTIQLGTNKLLSNDDQSVTLTAKAYYIHPDWNEITLENDIGLIRLEDRVETTDFIKPLGLISVEPLPIYASVVALGWGETADDSPGLEAELNYVFLTALSNEECQRTFGSQITDNMICVDGNYNEGTCFGDTGGPLLHFYGEDSKVYQAGVASFVSGNGCGSTDPSGFIRIDNYVDWINETIENID